MVQVELNNMYIDIGANSGCENVLLLLSSSSSSSLSSPLWKVLLLLLLLTAIDLSLGGCSPYTSTDKTNKNKYT
jgi:hypothetical protein